jgi:membrane protein DedA with SNARE-associated domain
LKKNLRREIYGSSSADAATSLLTVAFMGGVGYWGGNSVQILKKDLTRIEHIAMGVLMILIRGWILFKYFKGTEKVEGDKKGAKIEP